jgi:flagellar biosynthesis/type III secretory pathway protein FliH
MRGPFPFDLRLDDGARPIVGGAGRRPRPAPDKPRIKFDYPSLEALTSSEPAPPPGPVPEPSPPSPTFSEEELSLAVEAARQEAHAAAEGKVRTEMLASLEHRQAEALSSISERLAASQEALDRILGARVGASRDLALAVARALVAKALARQPLADIEAMFREILVRLEGLPWLELRLPPTLVDAGRAALARVAEEADYRGEIKVVPDARLGPGDARLTWQDGAAERDLGRLEAQVTALVEAWLPAAGVSIGRPALSPADRTGTARSTRVGPEHCPREAPTAAEPATPSADLDHARMDEFE